jgi:hypothetical protein
VSSFSRATQDSQSLHIPDFTYCLIVVALRVEKELTVTHFELHFLSED